ncbi:MAG: hypothetical protein K2K90_15005 [Lachnospiraceae bacterium]|nr:hypothetical protein [Lachnospiraceae bacterium]
MEPIPKPLLQRLVLTFLVGIGCFFTGLIFFLHQKDISFFILSILLSTGSAAKAILLGLQIRRKAYTVLEGTCTDVRLKLFRNTHDIVLTDQDGNEHLLRIGKDYKIRPGLSYRFYFRTPDSIPSGQSLLLAKAVQTDNLLGVEELR